MRVSSFVATTVMCIATSSGSALAQAAAASQVGTTDVVRQLYRDGAAAADAGNWALCRSKLDVAFSSEPRWQIAGQLGYCELKLGDLAAASDHLGYAKRTLPATETGGARDELNKMVDELAKVVATVTVRASVADAEIFLDDRSVGTSPIELFVAPGPHAFEARKAGFRAATTQATVTAGQKLTVTPVLVEESNATPITSNGYGSAKPWLILGSAIVAVGGLALGIAETVAANDASSDADEIHKELVSQRTPCPGAERCQDLDQALRDQSTAQDLAVAGYVVGGVGALAAIVFAVIPGSSEAPAADAGRVRLRPMMGLGQQGLMLDARF